VPVVKINPDVPPAQLGAMVHPRLMPARIYVVIPHGPADRAGVRVGDVVSTIDGASMARLTPMAVQALLGQHAPGTTVHLGLGRGAQTLSVDVVAAAQ
jgi:C-terminal processing protease CtpA/Prc